MQNIGGHMIKTLETKEPFNLGHKDFDSGRILPPSREEWIPCEICGKKMYKGYVLTNGARIGSECELSLRVFNGQNVKTPESAEFFSITKKQFAYFMENGR